MCLFHAATLQHCRPDIESASSYKPTPVTNHPNPSCCGSCHNSSYSLSPSHPTPSHPPQTTAAASAAAYCLMGRLLRLLTMLLVMSTGCCAVCGCLSPLYTLRCRRMWRPRRPLGSMPFTACSMMRSGIRCGSTRGQQDIQGQTHGDAKPKMFGFLRQEFSDSDF